jgi:hypothetical protein
MRQLKNNPERLFEALAQKNGWRTTKRGWPDFLCFHIESGEVIAVEVKPRINGPDSRTKLLKRDQAACMDLFVKCGIRCFVSDGVTLEPYSRDKHASERQRSMSRYVRRRMLQSGNVRGKGPDSTSI